MASPTLSEDDTEEILYLARTGETQEFKTYTQQTCEREKCTLLHLCETARDEASRNTMLHMASANGHVDFLREIFSSLTSLRKSTPAETQPLAAIVNLQNDSGNTALHWAALNGQLECVKLLMEHGGDPLIRNAAGHDAIYEAEVAERKDVVDWVLKEGGAAVEMSVSGGEGVSEEDHDEVENIEAEDKQSTSSKTKDGNDATPSSLSTKSNEATITKTIKDMAL